MIDEFIYVFKMFAQRRDLYPYYVQTVKQVLSEPVVLDHFKDILVACHYDADVDRHGFVAADRFHLVFLQYAEKFRLYAHRHLLYLIYEKSTVVGVLEFTYFAFLVSSGEGSFFISEKL